MEGGTGTSAKIGKPIAGKTGTTQDNKDAWFVGYTPTLTAAVWMGYADKLPDGSVPTMNEDSAVSRNHGLEGVTGGSLPAEIWRKFMREVTDGVDTGSFEVPRTFPGRVLNETLQQPTTTAPTSSTSRPPSTSSSTTPTTEPKATTTTVAPTSSSSSTSTSTTEEEPDGAPVPPNPVN